MPEEKLQEIENYINSINDIIEARQMEKLISHLDNAIYKKKLELLGITENDFVSRLLSQFD